MAEHIVVSIENRDPNDTARPTRKEERFNPRNVPGHD